MESNVGKKKIKWSAIAMHLGKFNQLKTSPEYTRAEDYGKCVL